MKNTEFKLELKNFCKELPHQFILAFKAGFFVGLITHIYIITNLILNHDSVGGIYTKNENLIHARWSVGTLSMFGSEFQLPVVTILIAIIMLALTAAFTVVVLNMENKTTVVLTSALIVTFPSVACIFSYMFTADAYFICAFFCAFAVYLTKRYRWGWIPGVVLYAIACGGYQAFICYAIGLFLMDCIIELFADAPLHETIKKGIKYIGVVLGGLILYYLILIVLQEVTGVRTNSYQGLNNINPFAFGEFLAQVPRTYRIFIQYFQNPYSISKFCQIAQSFLLVLSAGAIVYLVVARKLYQDWGRLLLLICGILLLPLALNFVTILSAGGWVHELMLYSFVLLLVFCIKLIEAAMQAMRQHALHSFLHICGVVLVGVVVWNNFCVTNIAYLRLQVCYENSFATANRIAARIESLDGYSPELPVAFVGEIGKDLYGGTVTQFHEFDYLTGTNDTLLYSIDDYTRTRNFLKDYIGLHMPYPSQEQFERLNTSEEVRAMPNYPAAGSVAIYDGIVVVKLSDGLIR